jgi:hypothetical protein
VHYHLGKANVVADTLNRKAHDNYLPAVPLIGEESSIRVLPDLSLYNITLTPLLREEIIVAQKNDEGMSHLRSRLSDGDPQVNYFREDVEAILWFKDRLVVPKKAVINKTILDEAHTSRYSIHPRSTKMYHDLRQKFWWTRMKREIARYESECDTCRRVKVDYMKPGGLLLPLSISDWKWEDISMDFIVGLPPTARKFDSIWVIVDRFTKSAHLYSCTPASQLRSTQRSMLFASSVCMEFQRRSSLIEGHNLLLASGNKCMLPLGLTWSTIQPTTRRWMIK